MVTWNTNAAVYGGIGLAVFCLFLFVLSRNRRRRLRRLAEESVWPSLWPNGFDRRARWKRTWRTAALIAILLAVARPRWGERWEKIEQRGLDIMVVLDVSRSMLAEDLKPNRIQQARWGIREWLPRLGGDRIGLVIFAGDAQVLCPLTRDQNAFRLLLNDARPERIARGGTNLLNGLQTAADALGPPAASDRVMVLISDGENHKGLPWSAVENLKARNIRVYAVGLGDPEGVPIPLPNPGKGESGFLTDRDGHVVLTRLDEQTLRRIALDTAGAYVRATPSDFGLERLYEEAMAGLRREPLETRQIRRLKDRFPLFLGLALFCLAMEFGRIRFRRNPAAPVSTAVFCAVFLLAAVPATEGAPEARERMEAGLRAYENEEWETAAEAFEEAARLAPETGLNPARARYNAGLARAKAGQYAEASAQFEEAGHTTENDVLIRSYYAQGRALAESAEAQGKAGNPRAAVNQLKAALEAFQGAMRLDPTDRDPKIAHELAQRRLKEMEDRVPPESASEPESNEKQDPETKPQADEKPGKNGEKDPSNRPKKTSEPDPTKPPADKNGPEPNPKENGSNGQPGPDAPGSNGTPTPREMTPEEAGRILDALEEEEAAYRAGIRPRSASRPVEKDW